jgi:hypothetical protein
MKQPIFRAQPKVIAITLAAGALTLFMTSITPSRVSAAGLNGDEAYTEGPQVCGECHQEAYDDWLAHGHSRKLGSGPAISALNGKFGLTIDARNGGFPLPRHDKDVYNWDNVLFIIGASKHWKTRFVGLDGNVLTKNGANQYNWQNASWSNYHKDEVKPFSCGTCHTTGYRKEGKVFNESGFPGVSDAGIPGIVGDFAHFNITCEACHGPGAKHASAETPTKNDIVVDNTKELCGSCHTRGSDPGTVIAKGGFIRHHEQYPEILEGSHKDLTCGTCHQPHVSRAQSMKAAPGNTEVCETCHILQKQEYQGSAMQKAKVRCQDCHMAKATKSAIAAGPYEGDVWTHIFRVDSSADYTMFTEDGKATKDAISLEFACFRCHSGADKEAYSKIENYHTIGK